MAGLISLGIASIPAPPAAAAAAPDLGVERGLTGTPIFGGFLRDNGEYNPALEGLAAVRVYEKMRRSDAQVAGLLAAVKLPIRSAQWTVRAPEDATPVEQEAAEFVEENLFEGVDFEAALENALLMLDFGAAAHEDCWEVDGGRIRLKKLAARLPETFYRWIVQPGSEDLVALEQQGWRADGFETVSVPASKLALFAWQQEGANFAGRSLLRPAYQHWYIKSSLYKIQAIALERNGLGIPTAVMGEKAKVEDRRAAIEWMQQLAAHEQAAIVFPNGWTFKLQGVEGEVLDPKTAIEHHNVMISMAGLAMFLNLGQSESGNRALGESQTDFFSASLEAVSRRIARTFNQTTVRRLVEFNFGAGVRAPRLEPQQIRSLGLLSVVQALKDLAGTGSITPGPEVEDFLRGRLGLPEAEKKPAAAAARVQVRGGGRSQKEGAEDLARAGRQVAASEFVPRRELRPAERCLALSEIAGELDRGRDAVAAVLRRYLPAAQKELVARLASTPVKRMHRVSLAPPEKLAREIEWVLLSVFEFGGDSVVQERAAQRRGAEPGTAATVRLAEPRPRKKRQSWIEALGVYADAIVSEYLNTITQRATNAALDWERRPAGLEKGERIQSIERDLAEQKDGWIDAAASKGVNEAFADGRAAAAEEMSDEVRWVEYSAILDSNTCAVCKGADGQRAASDADLPGVPNPDCEGGDKCRCVHIYGFADEGRS